MVENHIVFFIYCRKGEVLIGLVSDSPFPGVFNPFLYNMALDSEIMTGTMTGAFPLGKMGLHNMNYVRVSGEVIFGGKNILELPEDDYNQIRGGEIVNLTNFSLST